MNINHNEKGHNNMSEVKEVLGRVYTDGNGTTWFASVSVAANSGGKRREIHAILRDGQWRSWTDRDPSLFSEEALRGGRFPDGVGIDWDSCGTWGGPCNFVRKPKPPIRRRVVIAVEYDHKLTSVHDIVDRGLLDECRRFIYSDITNVTAEIVSAEAVQ